MSGRVNETLDNKHRMREEYLKKRKRRAERFSERLKKRQTPSEVRFAQLLDKAKVTYESQKVVMIPNGSFYIIDFFIPNRGVCVEIDGGYHLKEEQIELDKAKDCFLRGEGYHVLRLFNEAVKELDTTSLMNRLERYPIRREKVRVIPPKEPKIREKKFDLRFPPKRKKKSKKPKTYLHLDRILENKQERESRKLLWRG